MFGVIHVLDWQRRVLPTQKDAAAEEHHQEGDGLNTERSETRKRIVRIGQDTTNQQNELTQEGTSAPMLNINEYVEHFIAMYMLSSFLIWRLKHICVMLRDWK